MYKNFGYELFEKEDIIAASEYLYGYNWKDFTKQHPTADISAIVFAANMKRVQEVSSKSFIPYIMNILFSHKLKNKLITISPIILQESYKEKINPILYDKIYRYVADDMYGMANVWLEIKQSPPNLSHSIKGLFKPAVTLQDNGDMYVKLLPQDTFSYIFDLINLFNMVL